MPTRSEPIDQQKAKRFKLVREYLKLNQTEMAAACRTTQSTIARMEGGTRYVSDEIVKILFNKYNISPTYIIAGVGGIEYKKEAQTLIKDVRSLKEDIEVMKAHIAKIDSDIAILSKRS
jgi:transcriptional regulator with XRE-family HTH domain